MSKTETQPTKRNSDKHLFVNIMRKKRQFYLILQATPVRQKPGPRKILSKEMSYFTQEKCCCLSLLSFISFKRHMYRGGVAPKEERESFILPQQLASNLLLTFSFSPKTTELSLIALQRTLLSGFLTLSFVAFNHSRLKKTILYCIKPSYRQVNSLANMESITLHYTGMYSIWKRKK